MILRKIICIGVPRRRVRVTYNAVLAVSEDSVVCDGPDQAVIITDKFQAVGQ